MVGSERGRKCRGRKSPPRTQRIAAGTSDLTTSKFSSNQRPRTKKRLLLYKCTACRKSGGALESKQSTLYQVWTNFVRAMGVGLGNGADLSVSKHKLYLR